jgi:hypothetical protein
LGLPDITGFGKNKELTKPKQKQEKCYEQEINTAGDCTGHFIGRTLLGLRIAHGG